MADIFFKKEFNNGLYNYLHVSNPAIDPAGPAIETAGVGYNLRFHRYVSLAVFLTPHLKNHVITRFSPFIEKQSSLENVEAIIWKYEVLADDCNGLGIDKSFISAGHHEEEPFVLFSMPDLLMLTHFPEDTFGDNVSWCSIFSLQGNRSQNLKKLMHTAAPPDLSAFLQWDELFFNIVCSKETGYFDSLLIKSRKDIEPSLDAFQSILDPIKN